ncbi:MAG: hypothetical protein HY301_15385, partial [Verrucomicrobia bacterium]|nr:hypothetical protein [Verrucomicrobiota bacterium]
MNLDPNRKFVLRLVALLSLIFLRIGVSAQDKENFADRKALIVSNCPLVELRYFNFKNQNVYGQGAVFELSVGWKNISEQPLVAFEICILEFDPFNRRLRETRWLVAGKDSSDWTPLEPGASGGDGLTSRGDETVFTGIAYVVAARLKDGTI